MSPYSGSPAAQRRLQSAVFTIAIIVLLAPPPLRSESIHRDAFKDIVTNPNNPKPKPPVPPPGPVLIPAPPRSSAAERSAYENYRMGLQRYRSELEAFQRQSPAERQIYQDGLEQYRHGMERYNGYKKSQPASGTAE